MFCFYSLPLHWQIFDYFDLQCFLQSDITFYIILCIRFIILGKRFLITDVAMTIHIFLKDVDADADRCRCIAKYLLLLLMGLASEHILEGRGHNFSPNILSCLAMPLSLLAELLIVLTLFLI